MLWSFRNLVCIHFVGLVGQGRPVAAPIPTRNSAKADNTKIDIRASSEIRTHDPSVRADAFVGFSVLIIRARRWVDNIRMDLREIGWDDVDWIHLAQDRDQWRALVSRVMNLRVP
jgi:hypothetical protein